MEAKTIDMPISGLNKTFNRTPYSRSCGGPVNSKDGQMRNEVEITFTNESDWKYFIKQVASMRPGETITRSNVNGRIKLIRKESDDLRNHESF